MRITFENFYSNKFFDYVPFEKMEYEIVNFRRYDELMLFDFYVLIYANGKLFDEYFCQEGMPMDKSDINKDDNEILEKYKDNITEKLSIIQKGE